MRLQILPHGLRLLLVTVGLGIGTGLVGIACHYLLEGVQWVAFGEHRLDLLQQFEQAGGVRRFLVLCTAGCLAACFWYVLQRRYKILSIRKQIELVGDVSPSPLVQILHAVMQIAIVGAGASVGKEGAPREFGALLGSCLSRECSLTLKDQKVLIACGAGAGLAAVYQVPFASSLFIFETLGLAYSWQNFLLVLTSTYLATWVARPIVGHDAIYHLSTVSWSASSFLQAILIALIVTPLALVFSSLAKLASRKRRKDESILWALPLAFLVLGGNEGASGLSPLTQWCLWGNLDTIICLGDWIWLLSDLAFDSSWHSSGSSSRNAIRSNSLFRNDLTSSSDGYCPKSWIYRSGLDFDNTACTSGRNVLRD